MFKLNVFLINAEFFSKDRLLALQMTARNVENPAPFKALRSQFQEVSGFFGGP